MQLNDKYIERKVRGLRGNPQLNSLLDKMVANTKPLQGNGQVHAPDQSVLRSISDVTTSNILDSKAVFELLPDVELACQVLVSTILSPKDMVNTIINYKVVEGSLPPDIANPLLEVVKRWFTNTYKINEKMEEWLSDVLFHKGSCPLLIMPESSIDAMINGTKVISKESLVNNLGPNGVVKPLGFLGTPANKEYEGMGLESHFEQLDKASPYFDIPKDRITVSVEAQQLFMGVEKPNSEIGLEFKTKLNITDNFDLLKMPELTKKISEFKANNIIKPKLRTELGMEAGKPVNPKDLTELQLAKLNKSFYGKRNLKFTPGVVVPKFGMDANTGHPLWLKLPAESVIPVHVPSNPREHVGYFILLDMQGHPISNSNKTDTYSDLSRNLTMRRELRVATNSSAGSVGFGTNAYADQAGRVELDRMAESYGTIVEAELLARLRSGIYGNNVDVSAPEEVYRVMLARHLAEQKTTLMYVPAQLLTYMAFDYNDYGVGISLMDKTRVISSLRAVCIFANTMAAIKNATGKRVLNINLDPEDTNPIQTVNELIHHFINSNSASFPLGATSAKDFTDYLQKAGVSILVQGNSRYPSTSMTVDDKQSSIAMVDTQLTDDLKKIQTMSFGLSPETLDATQNVEFATSIVSSNLLLAKRTAIWSRVASNFLRKFVTTFIYNSQILVDMLKAVIKEKKIKLPKELSEIYKDYVDSNGNVKADTKDGYLEFVIQYFLDNLLVELPQPDTVSLEAKVTALESYTKALDSLIDAYISSDTFSDITSPEAVSSNIDMYKASIRAYFIRCWALDNNFLPELQVLAEFDDGGNPVFDLVKSQGEYIERVNDVIADFTIYIAKQKATREIKIAKSMPDTSGLTDANGNPTDSASDDGMGGSLDDGSGDDGDLDTGMDDNTAVGDDDTSLDDADATADAADDAVGDSAADSDDDLDSGLDDTK